jgi:enamine deaminase RidA (YjgF/YER057c/UK114 family)
MAGKKKKVVGGGGKTNTPKARRVTVSPARRRNVDPGWAWDDRLPLSQAKQIGNTIYVSGQIAYVQMASWSAKNDMVQTRRSSTTSGMLERGQQSQGYRQDHPTSPTVRECGHARLGEQIFGNDPPATPR